MRVTSFFATDRQASSAAHGTAIKKRLSVQGRLPTKRIFTDMFDTFRNRDLLQAFTTRKSLVTNADDTFRNPKIFQIPAPGK